MKIAISGISGFIGTELKAFFEASGNEVIGVPRKLVIDDKAVEELTQLLTGVHVVINLSGAPIIKRHTSRYRKILWNSRIKLTGNIVKAMINAPIKPHLFISASAVGIYKPGVKHDEYKFEAESGFLGKLVSSWEEQAFIAQSSGIRTCVLRFGVVLGRKGGVVKKLFPLFRSGLGAVILPSSSPFQWVHIEDVKGVCQHIIQYAECKGIYNLSANENTTQKTFARAFATALKRPLLFVVPVFFLKILYGNGAHILTNSPQVESVRLREDGYELKHTDIKEAMEHIFGTIRKE
jgi:uncharacterized protein